MNSIALIARGFLSWGWTKKFLYWLIISAGTVSECVFLVASIWMSINSSVHPLVRSIMSEQATRDITQIATAGYVALPELILGLACVTVYGHIQVWRYNKNVSSFVWSLLYGFPTLIFLVLSLITLGCSVTSTNFILPAPLIVIRALAGYMFAFTSLLYSQLGTPQEVDRLQEKDEMIANLQQQNAINLSELTNQKDGMIAELKRQNIVNLETLKREKDEWIAKLQTSLNSITEKCNEQKTEMENLKGRLDVSIQAERDLHKLIHKSNDDALQAYSEECQNWLKSGVKTANVDSIIQFTGIQKRKIEKAIETKTLAIHPRNKELILVSSLIAWLKTMQPNTDKAEEKPLLHIVNG